MAAKKSRTSRKSASEGVSVILDADTILTLKAAAEAMSQLASAMIMASDDPTVKRTASKTAQKRAGKSTKKSTRKSARKKS
jgi:hypothetical protein